MDLRRNKNSQSRHSVDPHRPLAPFADRHAWHDHVVNDYRVATHGPRLGGLVGREPEGKQHAYLKGASNTACGFGLNAMRVFEQLRFSLQPPSLKCPICKRIVAADH